MQPECPSPGDKLLQICGLNTCDRSREQRPSPCLAEDSNVLTALSMHAVMHWTGSLARAFSCLVAWGSNILLPCHSGCTHDPLHVSNVGEDQRQLQAEADIC